ncbi:MAG: glycosyltransferase family 4 protein [Candidatus Omnitrophica bacterium]|nr:glycosyltransferase family 4 protein [Candidatus Omnitrophota bacterium]
MKIGIIAVDFYPKLGGMENYAAQLAMNFRDMGHAVHLFIKKDGQDLNNVTNYKILTKDLFKDIPSLCRFDMDVWLAINSSYGILSGYKKNVFICSHGNDFLSPWVCYQFPFLENKLIWRFKEPLEKFFSKFILNLHIGRIKGIFPNSDYTKDRFLKMYPSAKDKISVINPGVDPNFFMTTQEKSKGRFNILSVTRLTNPRKNIRSVIEALSLLKDKYPFTYSVIGDGPMKEYLENLVKQKNLTDQVFIKGQVSYEELKESYRSSDLFVLIPKTDKNDVEGFGMVYLEANACGVPVLASRGNGSSNAVKEGISGYFVDEPDAQHCQKALEEFFSGKINFDQQKIIDHAKPFRWSNIAKQFIDQIESKKDSF